MWNINGLNLMGINNKNILTELYCLLVLITADVSIRLYCLAFIIDSNAEYESLQLLFDMKDITWLLQFE